MAQANDIQKELVEDFRQLGNSFLQYEFLLELAANMPPMTDEERRRAHKVKGCQSQVWLLMEADEAGRMIFKADSDTMLVRGVLSMIHDIYDGLSAAEIESAPFTVLSDAHIEGLFSDTRQNGIQAILNDMHTFAENMLRSAR